MAVNFRVINYLVSLLAAIEKAIKLEMKHPIGIRYRVNCILSSQKKSSTPKISKPKSISKIPTLVYFDTLLRVTILNDYVINPISFMCPMTSVG
jgi:hypothetical protein